MPAKWQLWFPFRIDAFRGSPAVQAMSPAARAGYIYLLASCWQSDDCSIPDDDIKLAEMSGLIDSLWETHRDRILRKFIQLDDGRLKNEALQKDWMEAKRVFESRTSAAQKTNKERWANGDRSVTDGRPSRSAYTRTGTGTGTNTEQKQKPSRVKAAGGAKDPTKTDEAKTRHADFKAIISEYWVSKNPGVQMPWDGREGKHLEMFLRAAPHITIDQFRMFLRNRYKSEVNHGERASQWIDWVASYAAGPMDRFGKTIGQEKNNGTNHNSPAKQRVDNNRRALAEAAIKRGWIDPHRDFGSGSAPMAEPGHSGIDGGISSGLRAVDPEILPPEGRGGPGGTAN